MPRDTFVDNHGPGPHNVAAGYGPQTNLNGAGTQNNYYAPFQDRAAVEAEKRRKEEEEILRKERKDCLRSLSFRNMDTRRQNIGDAHPNTCDWLLSTAEFKEWRDRCHLSAHNGVLWIKGKPGAGKSTLVNHTLFYYERAIRDHLIVSYFFIARGAIPEKTPPGMLRSMVYQLVTQDDILFAVLLESFREKRGIAHGTRVHWSESELKRFIRSITKQQRLQPKPLLLFVDAVDALGECAEKEVRDVVGSLEDLSVTASHVGVRLSICLSSRHYPYIRMKKNLEIIVEGRQEHEADIAAYVREKLNTEDDSFERQVQEKAGGIFLWVVIVVAMLNKAYDEGRHEAMQKVLDEVPEDLEGVFNAVLERDSSDKVELIRIL